MKKEMKRKLQEQEEVKAKLRAQRKVLDDFRSTARKAKEALRKRWGAPRGSSDQKARE